MSEKRVGISSAESAIRAGMANALAEALMVGIDECEAEGRPLNQLQRIYLARGSIMAYGEAATSIANLEFEATILDRRGAP